MRKLFFLFAAMLFLFITKAQNVGIGIATPQALLHLHQASFPTLLFSNSTTGSLGTDGTALLLDGNNFIVDNGENADIIMKTNLAERMRITGSGYVGIGTATPTLAQLQVEGMVGNTVAMFKGSSGSKGISFIADWPGIFFNSYFNGGVKAMSASGYPSFINTEQSTGALTFNTTDVPNTVADDPVTVPERMRIAGNGYVGIGAVSPNYNLQIHNSDATSSSLQLTNNFTDNLVGDGALITEDLNDLVLNNQEPGKLKLKTNGLERVTVAPFGFVGINQPTPTARLDVNGNVKITDGTEGAGKVLTSDAGGNASWQAPPTTVAFQAFLWFNSVSFNNGGFQHITFDSVGVNTGNGYNVATGIFTAPSDGMYYFYCQIGWSTQFPTNYGHVMIRRPNTSDVRTGYKYGITNETQNVSGMFYLNAGEQIEFGASDNSPGSETVYNQRDATFVYGYKVN